MHGFTIVHSRAIHNRRGDYASQQAGESEIQVGQTGCTVEGASNYNANIHSSTISEKTLIKAYREGNIK